MAKKTAQQRVGELIRDHRANVLKLSARQAADLLDCAQPHLTNLEKGKQPPSEELLLRIAKMYGLDENVLRSGWGRPDAVVTQVASQDPISAEMAPALMRMAKEFKTREQWEKLVEKAKSLKTEGDKP